MSKVKKNHKKNFIDKHPVLLACTAVLFSIGSAVFVGGKVTSTIAANTDEDKLRMNFTKSCMQDLTAQNPQKDIPVKDVNNCVELQFNKKADYFSAIDKISNFGLIPLALSGVLLGTGIAVEQRKKHSDEKPNPPKPK